MLPSIRKHKILRFHSAIRSRKSIWERLENCIVCTQRNNRQPRGRSAYAPAISELNRVLSDYDYGNSELSQLSATSPSSEPVHVSNDLFRILESAQALSEKSHGAFDITVGPLSKLWRRARRMKEMPPPDMLAAAREATDYKALQLDSAAHTAKLLKPNMRARCRRHWHGLCRRRSF